MSAEGKNSFRYAGRKSSFAPWSKVARRKTLHWPIFCDRIRWFGVHADLNFATIRKSLKRLQQIEKMEEEGSIENFTKRERLDYTREKEKLTGILGGIVEMRGLPSAMLIIDIKKEHIAVEEARKLNIPIFALVDTNVDPDLVDYPIPANDDALRSVQLFVHAFADAINNGRAAARARKVDEVATEGRPELNLERRGRRVEIEASDFMPTLQTKEMKAPRRFKQGADRSTATGTGDTHHKLPLGTCYLVRPRNFNY